MDVLDETQRRETSANGKRLGESTRKNVPLKDAGILSLHRFRRFGPLRTTKYYFFVAFETLSKTPFAFEIDLRIILNSH